MWQPLESLPENRVALKPGRVLEWFPWSCEPRCTNPLSERASIPLRAEEVAGAERVLTLLESLLAPYRDIYGDGQATYLPVLRRLRLVRDQDGWRLETEGMVAILEAYGDGAGGAV